MKPPLAALVFRPAVPGDAERLVAAAWHGYQILLQRLDAERIGDLVIMQRAVGTVDPHHELVAPTEECGDDAETIELCVREIAEHRGRRSGLHRLRVMGPLPASGLRCMTFRTDLAADESEPDRPPAQLFAAPGWRPPKPSGRSRIFE